MYVRLEQFSKAESPMVITLSEITTLESEEQSKNAFSPIAVTELPIVTLVRLVQLLKAQSLIVVTESGIIKLPVKPLQPLNAVEPIEITESGIKEGMKNPGSLNEDQINAARTQRMVDRIVGFRTSASIRREKCEAAGRVQSVVLSEIVSRDSSIKNFTPL